MKSGFGVYSWPSEKRYVGEFYNNCFHGKGKLTTENNEKYEGEW